MTHSMCGSLFEASKSLLENSGLIVWDGKTFVAQHPGKNDAEFEEYAKAKFDSTYGRYMCWVLFSVGAENLAKAACVCNKIVKVVADPPKLPYPRYKHCLSPAAWASKVLNESWDYGDPPQPEKYNYGTLEKYWKSDNKLKAYFESLIEKQCVNAEHRTLLLASYKYLTQAIRNRDAHTYIADQRRRDYPAVEPIFVPAFKTLVNTMKDNGHPL